MTTGPITPPPSPADYIEWNGALSQHSDRFNAGTADLRTKLDLELDELTKDPSSAKLLSKVQSLMSEYTLYRQAQATTTKALADANKTIVQNT